MSGSTVNIFARFEQQGLTYDTSVNISISKTAAQIAEEIKRHIINPLEPGVVAWHEIKAATEATDNQLVKTITAIHKALYGTEPDADVLQGGEIHAGDMEIRVEADDEAEIQLRGLTTQEAIAIIYVCKAIKIV